MARQKLTLEQLQAFVRGYVNPLLQAGEYQSAVNTFTGMIEKIGLQIMLDGDYGDDLSELDGIFLPLGKTIEEYYIDMPVFVKSGSEEDYNTPYEVPTIAFEDAVYSFPLGEFKNSIKFKYDEVESAMISAEAFSNLVGRYMERQAQAVQLWKYNAKKQMLHNNIVKAIEADTANSTHLVQTIAKPSDASTGAAFIKSLKKLVKDARFPNEHNNLKNKGIIGKTPKLTLYILKDIMPEIEVDTLAGAFNLDKLAFPCDIIEVNDLGKDEPATIDGVANPNYVDTSKVYAILVDSRSIKLHPTYDATRTDTIGVKDEIVITRHLNYTGFIAAYTYVKVIKDVDGE